MHFEQLAKGSIVVLVGVIRSEMGGNMGGLMMCGGLG
jgi:hypothetical protein